MGVLRFSLVAFLLILLIKKKFDLGLTLVICSLSLGLMYQMPPLELGITFYKSTVNLPGFMILTAVMMIIFLSELMKKAGRIKMLVSSLRSMLGDPRGVVTLVPAMIGLLPIIGGAMISAPMVEEASEELDLTAPKKTFLNYWFRHLWEYIFPTYPGMIFSAAILGISLQDVAKANIPLTITAIAAGLFFGMKGVGNEKKWDGGINRRLLTDFFVSALPLIVVISAVLITKTETVLDSLIVLNVSLIVVFIFSAFLYRIGPKGIWEIVKANFSIKFISIVIGILIFKGIIETTGAVEDISMDLNSFGVPVFLILIILPFIIGVSTGITMAFVGITFPILLPFFTTGDYPMIAVMLAYAGGYAGVMLSPVHLCLVLTAEYFRADLGEVYKEIVKPVAVVLGVALAVYLVCYYLL